MALFQERQLLPLLLLGDSKDKLLLNALKKKKRNPEDNKGGNGTGTPVIFFWIL